MRKFKPVKMSKRTELWYRQQLKQFVKTMTDDVERAMQQPQGSFFMDDAKGFQAISAKALMKVLEKYEKSDRTSQAENIANGFVGRGDAQNHAEVSTNLKNQTGIDLSAYLRNSPNIAERVNALTAGNIQLIKSIRSQYLDKVQNTVMQAMVRGSLNKDLAAQVKDLGKTTEKRAMFIARDQSSKLNAALTQARHEEVGIKKYMWSTSGDERVRESHAEKDGQIFEYANPPADTGHPGHDVNCRCVQIPVLDDVVNLKSEETELSYQAAEPNKTGKMDLDELFESSIGGGGNKSFSNFGGVNSELITLAKESIGLDITDWQHSIDESSIRHILKQHGNEKAENKRGQRAVTKKDILLLPLVVSAFDSIEYTGTSDSGNETFLIKKEIDDEIFSVQEVRKRHKKIAVKTMWIKRKKKATSSA
ncbi:TPA: phage minor head protein [Haemophilus influenzae]|nr:phage minor head protein [Haemophilus influenzae]MCK8846010.1 phage minor head protein [Haemophilus influenzae]MCK8903222.1 phage minor head protein [Haemophilus influenzae]MCK9108298.1 phage minor head protein [Haemophilus influenzae]MCK9115580.1 phage minor head protein [Haemophilus influenzae]